MGGGGGFAIFAVKLDMSARSVCVCNCHKSCKLAEGNLWSDRENTGNFAASVRSVCVCNKGFSILPHLQGKGCKTGLCGQAWSFPLFDPM